MSRAVLVDTTICMACRGCQVACKQWNDLPAEKTKFFAGSGGYENPPKLSANSYTIVGYTEVEKGGLVKWVFTKRQCMQCLSPACMANCPVGAITRTAEGAVLNNQSKCIGCKTCEKACPFGTPAYDESKEIPVMKKCTFCANRLAGDWFEKELNGKPMAENDASRYTAKLSTPICAKTCCSGALRYGDRNDLIAEAKRRLAAEPGKYVKHIYGEKEAGGTSWLYLAGIPFADLGFPKDVKMTAYAQDKATALAAVPAPLVAAGTALSGLYWIAKRRNEMARNKPGEPGK